MNTNTRTIPDSPTRTDDEIRDLINACLKTGNAKRIRIARVALAGDEGARSLCDEWIAEGASK